MWDGKERRSEHICMQEEKLGRFEEFMENTKGLKATLFLIGIAIATQVITFAFLWGGLTETVKFHDKDISRILTKLDTIKIVYAQGEQGKNGR